MTGDYVLLAQKVAQRQLGNGAKVPEGYVEQLAKFLEQRPTEISFVIHPEPGKTYGYILCYHPGCRMMRITLEYDDNRELGGITDGVGSLTAYELHCDMHHGNPSGSQSSPATPQAGPSGFRSRLLDQLDGKAPATLPRHVKREVVEKEAPKSVPSKRPWAYLNDARDDDIIDLTMDEPSPMLKKLKQETQSVKREPLDRVGDGSLPSQPSSTSISSFDDDIIDLTVEDIPSWEIPRPPPVLMKQEPIGSQPSHNPPHTQLLQPFAAPSTSDANGGLSPVRLGQVVNPADLQRVLTTILGDYDRVHAEIIQLRRKARLGGGGAQTLIAMKERELADLRGEAQKVREDLVKSQARHVSMNAIKTPDASSPDLAPKVELIELEDSGDDRRLSLPTPGPSRPPSREFAPTGLAPAFTPELPRSAILQYNYVPPGGMQQPGSASQFPGTTAPSQVGFGQLAQNAAQYINNGLNAGANIVQTAAQMAAQHMAQYMAQQKQVIPATMNELVGAGAPAFGPSRLPDDGSEDVDDAFRRPDVDAVNEFVLAAGNATIFDENISVMQAMKGLGLENQQQLLPGMECFLLPHQLIAVKWMNDLETDKQMKRYGGILADEMGLGKTVQMIALMCKNPAPAGQPRATLVVAPLSLLEQWKSEILDKTNTDLQVHIYHSSNPQKSNSKNFLQNRDVVITTYGTLAGEMPKEMMQQQKPDANDLERARRKAGILFQASWHRVILDEAHNIRNRATRQSQAVSHLDARYRWCLTGTPVINGLADFYGYFRFIRLWPWQEWKRYNEHVHILKTCLLRRKKDSMLDGKRLIELTRKEVVQTVLDFSPEERQIYMHVQGKVQAVFNSYLRAGTVLKNYSHILVLILRLKQLCCHPSLIQEKQEDEPDQNPSTAEAELKAEVDRAVRLLGQPWVDQLKTKLTKVMVERVKTEQRSLDEEVENDVCPVCFDTMTDPVVTACSHIYCRDCIDKLFERPMEADPEYKADQRPCPSCRQPISLNRVFIRYVFEPTDAELNKLVGTAPEVMEIDSDDEDEIFSLDELIDLGLSPRRRRDDKLTVKKEIKELAKRSKIKRERLSSPTASEDANSDDSIYDFIVHTDEDEDEKDRLKAMKKKKGKLPEKGKARSLFHNKAVKREDSDEDSEEDSEEDSKPIKLNLTQKRPPRMSKFLPSTKRMMESIKTWSQQYPADKVIVISQFTACLDLVARYLDENEVSYVRYQGDMGRNERDDSVHHFQRKKGGPRAMLMSLKAGGVGLNLTRANRVIALDLAWSEAVEQQAYDRVHRLGQTKDVLVERLIIKDSIEDQLLKIQERKRALADGSLGEGARGKMGRLSVREIAALFGIHDLRRH